MFTNIGNKIKTLAKVLCIIGIAFSVIMGLVVMIAPAASGSSAAGVGVVGGILYIVLGSLISWLASLTTYGFGHLICNTEEIKQKLCGAETDEQ